MGDAGRILIISVGGSSEPIVKTLKYYKDKVNYVIFLCSEGDSKENATKYWVDEEIPQNVFDIPNNHKGKSLISLSGYKGKYKILAVYPDNLDSIYDVLIKECESFDSRSAEIIADFTGGTKSMSAAVVLLAVKYENIRLISQSGIRRDSVKITDSMLTNVRLDKILAQKAQERVSRLWQRYYYSAARIECELFLASRELSYETKNKFIQYRNCSQGFALWDSFNFKGALDALKPYQKRFSEHIRILEKLANKSEIYNGYRLAEVINNAKRRAYNGEYDNAVARIYRALEFLGQIALKLIYNLDSDDIKINFLKIKNVNDVEYWENKADKNGVVKMGLIDDYKLLSALPDTKEDIGKCYSKSKYKMKELINKRNYSILAHGAEAVSRGDYEKLIKFWEEFSPEILEIIKSKSSRFRYKAIGLPQRVF